jgi:hypothetical protein
MIRSGKSLLIAGVLVAVAGSAYAQQAPQQQAPQQQAPRAVQQSYQPAPAMPAAAPIADPSNPDHFVPPPGYYENRAMAPYSRPGYGPKPN